jgi:hypothetical protein
VGGGGEEEKGGGEENKDLMRIVKETTGQLFVSPDKMDTPV